MHQCLPGIETNVLVDQKNSNVLSVLREVLESLLDLRGLGLGIDD